MGFGNHACLSDQQPSLELHSEAADASEARSAKQKSACSSAMRSHMATEHVLAIVDPDIMLARRGKGASLRLTGLSHDVLYTLSPGLAY